MTETKKSKLIKNIHVIDDHQLGSSAKDFLKRKSSFSSKKRSSKLSSSAKESNLKTKKQSKSFYFSSIFSTKRPAHWRTLVFEELPDWMKDNHYIRSGYRQLQFSYQGCIESLFYLHNETGNIYTHGLGAIGFATAWITVYHAMINVVKSSTWADYFAMGIFVMGVTTCLGLSGLFHLFSCHSQTVSRGWNKLDYVGIVVLIVTSFFPPVYYGFKCHPYLQAFYLSSVSIFGVITISVTASNRYTKPEYRFLRTFLFSMLGLCGIFPVTHNVIKFGYQFARVGMSVNYILAMGAFYVLGAFVYVSRVPEKWFPGKFDYFFHSHQIFHCLVLTAAITHWIGVLYAFEFWHSDSPLVPKCDTS